MSEHGTGGQERTKRIDGIDMSLFTIAHDLFTWDSLWELVNWLASLPAKQISKFAGVNSGGLLHLLHTNWLFLSINRGQWELSPAGGIQSIRFLPFFPDFFLSRSQSSYFVFKKTRVLKDKNSLGTKEGKICRKNGSFVKNPDFSIIKLTIFRPDS